MSYYDDEYDERASARAMWMFFKLALNGAIIVILYKLLYIPNYPDFLRESNALYVMPIVGTIGAYFYLAYWFGKKLSLYLVGAAVFSVGLAALTSFDTVFKLYTLAVFGGLVYGCYLLIRLIINFVVKKR